jgi:cytochrome c oxidase assembly factor CtaG
MPHGTGAWLLLATLFAAAAIYARGWSELSRRTPLRFGVGRLVAFVGGLAIIAVALASPLDTLAGERLSAHMVQHQLLMMLAPPLLWLGAPTAPMLLGLPRRIRRPVVAALAARLVRPVAHILALPLFGWVSFSVAFWTWHTPLLYDLALRSHLWHHVEHACFFTTAMLFWRPVIVPWPARSAWPRWTTIPYLVLADVQNTILAAILTLSDRVIYPAYAIIPRGNVSPLDDQSWAGLIMWVPGSLVFLVAAVGIALEMLASSAPAGAPAHPDHPTRRAVLSPTHPV